MVFREWEESHSAVKVLLHAAQGNAEVALVENLLVSGKKPPSLAKFVTTSDVFRRRFGDAQQKDAVALCTNLGWAPQRYTSRARPLARMSRRWRSIWAALEEEAASTSKRADDARHLMAELGGVNSPRLLLGGMLADIAAEHYDWVAGGDRSHPDPSTAVDRADLFTRRLSALFTDATA
eukprot:2299311-Pyramimonas_sp.AAC.1